MTMTFAGVCGLIWYCFWLWLTFEKPAKHPSISARELRYIEDSLGQGQALMPVPTLATTPWRKFLTSMPVYAIIVANFCRSWNFYLLVLFQPRFMHESFDMPLVEVMIWANGGVFTATFLMARSRCHDYVTHFDRPASSARCRIC